MNIILIGMPGSGKTSAAEELGRLLCRRVTDTDAAIAGRYGDIKGIFERYGEERFRDMETEAIKEACGLDNAVISTGGGSVLRKENIAILKCSGKTVYLKASLKTLVKRARGDNSRPLLMGDTERRLCELEDIRTPLYLSAADICVETDNLSPRAVAENIIEKLKDCL